MSYINAERFKNKVRVWERNDGVRETKIYDAPWYFYVEDPKGDHTTLTEKRCSKLEFPDYESFNYAKTQLDRSRVKKFESDIAPEYKILSTHYYNKPSPKLNVSYLDIEVDYDKKVGFSSVANPYAPINAIALYNDWSDETWVLTVPPKTWGERSTWESQLDQSLRELGKIVFFDNEKQLLLKFLEIINDSDALCGWNSDFFDIPYICKRLELVCGKSCFYRMSFDDAYPPRYREVERFGGINHTVDLGGRLSIDYMMLFKKFEQHERPSYKLEAISEEMLPGLSKLSYDKSLYDLYREDFNHFIRYNLRDTECLRGFEQKMGYVAIANIFVHLSTGLFKNVQGTVKLAELALVNLCHSRNVIAPDVPKVDTRDIQQAKGASVLKPKTGLKKKFGAIDIKSLYPNVIRSMNISPEKLIGQFSEMVGAIEAIISGTPMPLTFIPDEGESETHCATEWPNILRERNCAVSGYGTVFNQESQGIIPAILGEWYAKRKEYKKLASKYEAEGDDERSAYYDRLQYCYKIKLNSLYGALLNKHFRFYDSRMGESTTGTGRLILQHMCGTVNEAVMGIKDPDGEAIIYGDTDSIFSRTIVNINSEDDTIESHFNKLKEDYPLIKQGDKEYLICNGEVDTPCVESDTRYNKWENKPVNFIYRHKTPKRMFKIATSSGEHIICTEDHSLTVISNGKLESRTPTTLRVGDQVVQMDSQ